MSIRYEVAQLKERKKRLGEVISCSDSTLNNIKERRSILQKKLESLETCTSSLAQTLREKVKKELSYIRCQIIETEGYRANMVNELEEVNKKIFERCNDYTLYIDEQSKRMIESFLDYVERNAEDIGFDIERHYKIKDVTKHVKDRYYGCDTPTGNVAIFDEQGNCLVTTSCEFYFNQKLYELSRSQYDGIDCIKTEWYNEFFRAFVSKLLETLKKEYKFSEFFTLTIEEEAFTLTLV